MRGWPRDTPKTAMKRFVVRIQDGARPHLKVIEADTPDEAAERMIRGLDHDEALLGAKICVWEHGKLQRNRSPLYIISLDPFEVSPDLHAALALREERRRAKWLEAKTKGGETLARTLHEHDEPYEHWLAAASRATEEGLAGFFGLPSEVRREGIDLREQLKHVPPGLMSPVQARFAAAMAGFHDLHRHESHLLQERILESLEAVHHRLAGMEEPFPLDGADGFAPLGKLASLIGAAPPAKRPMLHH